MNASGMSKKAAVAGMAITSIAASENWKTQAFVFGVSAVAIIAQALLDYYKKEFK